VVAAATEGIMKGTVKWFNAARGFGFLSRDDGGEDSFVHWTDIQTVYDDEPKTLTDGQAVEFEVVDSPRGVRAMNVRSLATLSHSSR
jgi:CspA family cold shock protein